MTVETRHPATTQAPVQHESINLIRHQPLQSIASTINSGSVDTCETSNKPIQPTALVYPSRSGRAAKLTSIGTRLTSNHWLPLRYTPGTLSSPILHHPKLLRNQFTCPALLQPLIQLRI
jgi:hypothetical protein